jgi:hypothetical protein
MHGAIDKLTDAFIAFFIWLGLRYIITEVMSLMGKK